MPDMDVNIHPFACVTAGHMLFLGFSPGLHQRNIARACITLKLRDTRRWHPLASSFTTIVCPISPYPKRALTVPTVLTFDDEVELIWKASWSMGKGLFLINRYYSIASVVFNNYGKPLYSYTPAKRQRAITRILQPNSHTFILQPLLSMARMDRTDRVYGGRSHPANAVIRNVLPQQDRSGHHGTRLPRLDCDFGIRDAQCHLEDNSCGLMGRRIEAWLVVPVMDMLAQGRNASPASTKENLYPMEPNRSNGGIDGCPFPGGWPPSQSIAAVVKRRLTLTGLCIVMKAFVVLVDAVRLLELLSSCVQARILSWSPLVLPLLMEGATAHPLSSILVALEHLLKQYLVLKLLIWLTFGIRAPLSQFSECVLILLLKEIADMAAAEPSSEPLTPVRSAYEDAASGDTSLLNSVRSAQAPTADSSFSEATSVLGSSLGQSSQSQTCPIVAVRNLREASKIPRRTPQFSSFPSLTKQRGSGNGSEKPSLIPLRRPTPPRWSLPTRTPSTRPNTPCGVRFELPEDESDSLWPETPSGARLEVGRGVESVDYFDFQNRGFPSTNFPATPNACNFEYSNAGSMTGYRSPEPLPETPSPSKFLTPCGSLLVDETPFSTPLGAEGMPSVEAKATRLDLLSSWSPFSELTASIMTHGRRRPSDAGELDHRPSTGMAGQGNDSSCDSFVTGIEDQSGTPSHERLQFTSVEHFAGSDHNDIVTLQATWPSSQDAQVGPPMSDSTLSLDFPSTSSAIFPSLLNELFDSSNTTLARHFNDIDLTSPAAERLLRNSVGSMESLDTLVRYMFEKDLAIDDVCVSPLAKRGERAWWKQGNAQHAEHVNLPAPLANGEDSGDGIHRDPGHSAVDDKLSLPILKGKLKALQSELLALHGEMDGEEQIFAFPPQHEGLGGSASLALTDLTFSHSFGSKISLPHPPMSIKKISSSDQRVHHRRTDDVKRPSWKL
ncbi:hypothetical protein NMY22_g2871 [Coprinellus aureogranulatus]|nr:hypothetical protein NMY22_g2871 [Coprinellus aureogranulatus]